MRNDLFARSLAIPRMALLVLGILYQAHSSAGLEPILAQPELGSTKNNGSVANFNLPGEVIDFRTGEFTPTVSDLSIPLNGDLEINVIRSFDNVEEPQKGVSHSLMNWHLEVPKIIGNDGATCSSPKDVGKSIYAPSPWHVSAVYVWDPLVLEPAISAQWTVNNDMLIEVEYGRVYTGFTLYMPGQQARQLLINPAGGYVTSDNWKVDCITSGFSVKSPSGDVYEITKRSVPKTSYRDQGVINVENVCLGLDDLYEAGLFPYSYVWLRYLDPNCFLTEQYYNVQGPLNRNVYNARHWYATTITDRNNNFQVLDYVSDPNSQLHLKTITANDQVVEYNYIDAGIIGNSVNSVYKLDNVKTYLTSNPTNKQTKVTYHYTDNRLTSVAYPEGESIVYGYDAAGKIGSITTPQGGVVSYTYQDREARYFGDTTSRKIMKVLRTRTTAATNNMSQGQWTFNLSQGAGTSITEIITPTGREELTYERNSGWNHGLIRTHKIFGYHFTGITNGGIDRSGDWGRYAVNKLQFGADEEMQSTTYQWLDLGTVGDNDVERRPISITKRRALSSLTIIRKNSSYKTEYKLHDTYGNPKQVVETNNKNQTRTSDLTYLNDTSKWIIGIIKDAIHVGIGDITRTFDGNGNLRNENRFGSSTVNTYHPNGELHTTKDARNHVTTYTNYYRGIPKNEEHPDLSTISREINPSGTIKSETDSRFNTTIYHYDGLDRVTRIDYPVGEAEVTLYTTNNIETTRGSYKLVTYLNGFGLSYLTLEDDVALGTVEEKGSLSVFDALSRVTFQSNVSDNIAALKNGTYSEGTDFAYDGLNRGILVHTRADDSLESYEYDETTGNRVEYIDQLNNATSTYYRSWGSPQSQEVVGVKVGPLTNPVADFEINRELDGQVGEIKNIKTNSIRSFTYNSNRFLKTATHPETGVTTYGRDLLGNPTSVQVGNSPTTIYAHDNMNRVSIIDYPGSTPDVTFGYDENGNIISIGNAHATMEYEYDQNNEISEEYVILDGMRFRTSYRYDTLGLLDRVIYPSGQIVDYKPSALGYPTQALPFVKSVSYYPSGHEKNITYGNNVVTQIALNSKQHISRLTSSTGGSDFIDYGYDYYKTRNVETITNHINTALSKTLVYDALNRLKNSESVSAPLMNAIVYDYDDENNISVINQLDQGVAKNLVLNYEASTNRLSSVTGHKPYTIDYDVYGNVKKTNASTGFTYDDAKSMTMATISGKVLMYAYDGNNKMVRTLRDGSYTYYVNSHAGNRTMKFDKSNGVLKEHFFLNKKRIADDTLSISSGVDTDNDGIDDYYELTHGLNLSDAADRNQDLDNDQVSNYAEYIAGSDLWSSDTDGDGVSDFEEIFAGVDGYTSDPTKNDSDGDGVDDLAEFNASTDPRLNIPALIVIINSLILN